MLTQPGYYQPSYRPDPKLQVQKSCLSPIWTYTYISKKNDIRNFRNISVVLESGDLSEDLEAEGLGEQGDPTAPSAKVSRRALNILIA